jgi:hypothetical protein
MEVVGDAEAKMKRRLSSRNTDLIKPVKVMKKNSSNTSFNAYEA